MNVVPHWYIINTVYIGCWEYINSPNTDYTIWPDNSTASTFSWLLPSGPPLGGPYVIVPLPLNDVPNFYCTINQCKKERRDGHVYTSISVINYFYFGYVAGWHPYKRYNIQHGPSSLLIKSPPRFYTQFFLLFFIFVNTLSKFGVLANEIFSTF